MQPEGNVQRTGKPGETEERPGQDANHIPQNLQAHDEEGGRRSNAGGTEAARHQREREVTQDIIRPPQNTGAGDVRKERVNWPTATAKKEWEMFDRDVDQVLEAATAGHVGKKLKAMSSIIWSMGADRFGRKELKGRANIQPKENRRLKEISILRGDLRRLKKAFREATAYEKLSLTEIRNNSRERIKILRRAECHRRDRKQRLKERVAFTKNPFQYVSKLLGDKRSGELKTTKEEVEEHLRQVHSDPRREESLYEMENLIKPPEPTIPFKVEEPSWQEVNSFLKKARGKSAPGPKGILYNVYKQCERLRKRL